MKESKAGRFCSDFQPVSVYRLRYARLTGAGCNRVCVAVEHTRTHTQACSHMGSDNLKSTPTIAHRGRNAPRQKEKKQNKTQKLGFLHRPRLAGCVVWCLLDHRGVLCAPPPRRPPTPPCTSVRLPLAPTAQLLQMNANHSVQLLAPNNNKKKPSRQNGCCLVTCEHVTRSRVKTSSSGCSPVTKPSIFSCQSV